MEKMKVVKLLATQSGVSQQTGNPWKSREVVLEAVQNAIHPDKYVARLFGDAVDKFTAKEGDVICRCTPPQSGGVQRQILRQDFNRGFRAILNFRALSITRTILNFRAIIIIRTILNFRTI